MYNALPAHTLLSYPFIMEFIKFLYFACFNESLFIFSSSTRLLCRHKNIFILQKSFYPLFITICFICFGSKIYSQEPDKIFMNNINGVKLFIAGNQEGYPIISLGTEMALELHFDDMDGNVKTYNYTYQLCDINWQPADLSPLDYLHGFTQGRLNQYRSSSYAKTKYMHYQALLPAADCMPMRSGNYLLKVYLNGDTAKLAFTKRILIVNNIVPVGAKITQPFRGELFRTHQKINFSIDKAKIDIFNQQQQLNVVVLQNYRWDNAAQGLRPTFMRGNIYEYSGVDDCVFPAGRDFSLGRYTQLPFL